jgi:hypothetical protein
MSHCRAARALENSQRRVSDVQRPRHYDCRPTSGLARSRPGRLVDNTIGDGESFTKILRSLRPPRNRCSKMIVECDRRGPMSSSPASDPHHQRGQEREPRRQSRRPNHTIGLASAQGSSRERHQRSTCSAIAASGGSVNASEAGSPWLGSAAAATLPILPMPDPPYVSASVLRISRHRPSAGTPMR